MSIISISGRSGSGKDSIGKIIQVLTQKPSAFEGFCVLTDEELTYKVWDVPTYKIKKFADKLKDMVCLMLDCTREDLEDQEYKRTPLGEEWNKIMYCVRSTDNILSYHTYECNAQTDLNHYDEFYTENVCIEPIEVIMTPRLMLQLLGTECVRNVIHPNAWVNATMKGYNSYSARGSDYEFEESKWIITDTRFPNEIEAIKKRDGLTIQVIKSEVKIVVPNEEHISESALDNEEFDHVIYNDGSMLDLVEKVRTILIKEEIL